MNKAERIAHLLNSLNALGFSFSEAQRLRRIAMTFSRWDTEEANGTIQRDDATGKPFRASLSYSSPLGQRLTWSIPDREAGANKRLASIMAAHPDLWAYHQGDPRGASLYVGRVADLKTDVNQIVEKARSWGARIVKDKGPSASPWSLSDSSGFICRFITEESAAVAYLEDHKGASIPARDLLPLDQYYSKGVAICV